MKPVDASIIEKIAAIAAELPEEQRHQLLELLSGWKSDIRQAQRERYTELLNFTSDNGSHYGHARDVSATGVFIETPADFEIGEQVKLMLTFISSPNPVKLRGEVVRKNEAGIGIHFDVKSQSQVKELDAIISKHALILHQR